MKVVLLSYTKNADEICAAAGRSCYSGKPADEIIGKGDARSTLSSIVGMGHHSVIEHATFTFSVSGVSRTLTHQLVRHRIASFSQQSQRYVSLDQPTYVVPHTIAEDPEALDIYKKMMEQIWNTYSELSEKVPIEDARYILPNGCTTNITITMNARELLHFFSLRCCERAQWEIREMAEEMLRLCREVSPTIFKVAGPPCVTGPCPEGEKSCGQPKTIKKH
ncbi:MAG TPA: FAD-dependent thymidylate synthase [Candidatus Methanomethylophilaceae archaeon]|nr:FAD-dependent thymidylate synthase [Candidatus Methanomethylophilaceae archaeon]